MRISVPREVAPREARVAIVPDGVARLVGRGFAVSVQRGAGAAAGADDADYQAAGARVEPDAAALWRAGDLVVKVRSPCDDEVALCRDRALVSLLHPLVDGDRVRALAGVGATAIAADMVPRTTLAQMMDVLTSQATIAGYRAVVLAAEAMPRLFPMMMTAAGTIAPARVLVLGAGVAGLQAIATARRLGAVVEAFDVRRAAKEQVESLGARFVEVPGDDAQGAGGYAREVSDAYGAAQAVRLGEALGRADAVITTALVPGRRAPILIPAELMSAMRPGTVVIDLAAEQGGNCAATRAGQRVVDGGVVVIGAVDVASQVAVHASAMYSRNMEKLIAHVTCDGALALDAADPIVAAMLIVRGGAIVHPAVAATAANPEELAA